MNLQRIDLAGPIGYQPVEFLDIPPMSEAVGNPPAVQRHGRRLERLSDTTRSRLASSARDYIEDLVDSCDGSADDVRTIIRELDADADGGDSRRQHRLEYHVR